MTRLDVKAAAALAGLFGNDERKVGASAGFHAGLMAPKRKPRGMMVRERSVHLR